MTDFELALEQLVKTKPARRREADNGEYRAYISKIDAKVNDKGTHWLSIKCDLDDEQYVFVNFWFTSKGMEISFQQLERLARDFGLKLDRAGFYQGKMEYILELFKPLEGEIVDLKVYGEVGNQKYTIRRKP
jgi:hypothetical protein